MLDAVVTILTSAKAKAKYMLKIYDLNMALERIKNII